MNKEITIYEFLGLIKDGEAPEVIRYKQLIYCKEFDGYYTSNELKLKLSIMNDLNAKVEIIEEDKKIEEIERLNNKINKDLEEFNDKLNTFKWLENDFKEHSIHYYQLECLVEYLKQLKENK